MLRSVLLFLAGVLVGANVVYYLSVRGVLRPATDYPESGSGNTVVAPPDGSADAPVPASIPTAQAIRPSPSTSPTLVSPPTSPGLAAAASPAGLLQMPVQGIDPAQLRDTFNESRGGTRIHEAQDIMAPRGTPVVAAADGRVVKLFDSNQGGLTVYQFDPTETYAYYYAHLDAYATGLREGQLLRRGDPIGTVGSTGNARTDAPHLHFAIFLLGPEKRWWEGTPVNPYPLLRRE
jgi:murein DD-endopeptidase MepM/ murein hydrolase activator NlpD